MTIDVAKLRARIAEMEARRLNPDYTPAKVFAIWQFDLEALKLLLTLIEKGES